MSQRGLRSLSESICTSCKRRATTPQWSSSLRAFSNSLPTKARGRDAMESVLAQPQGRSRRQPTDMTDFAGILESDMPQINDAAAVGRMVKQPHRMHVYATKHNTHITFTEPAAAKAKFDQADLYKPPEPNKPLMSFATGMIGFRKAGRGTYDAAYQLASYVLKQIQERGLLRDIREVEVVLRGWGAGREAVTKAILGQEGRFVRPKITSVTDATRLKFGGSRSPNPRRLG